MNTTIGPTRTWFRHLFSPILRPLESADDTFTYKPLHRATLIVLGCLFTFMAFGILWLSFGRQLGYLLPVMVFGGAGMISLIIGVLGTNRAVANLWGSRR